jgi:hypothetical protein
MANILYILSYKFYHKRLFLSRANIMCRSEEIKAQAAVKVEIMMSFFQ